VALCCLLNVNSCSKGSVYCHVDMCLVQQQPLSAAGIASQHWLLAASVVSVFEFIADAAKRRPWQQSSRTVSKAIARNTAGLFLVCHLLQRTEPMASTYASLSYQSIATCVCHSLALFFAEILAVCGHLHGIDVD
jgi:hypothetical protein